MIRLFKIELKLIKSFINLCVILLYFYLKIIYFQKSTITFKPTDPPLDPQGHWEIQTNSPCNTENHHHTNTHNLENPPQNHRTTAKDSQ